MDRRQKKTRMAIFRAFIQLLKERELSHITVGQIIERADVGRATFYAHFETREQLQEALCRELFAHIFAGAQAADPSELFACDAPDSVFVHLLQHLKNNDNQIRELLTCQSNSLFLGYFQRELKALVCAQLPVFAPAKPEELPEDYWVGYICAVFVDTVRWWLEGGMTRSPQTVARYFLLAVMGKTAPALPPEV